MFEVLKKLIESGTRTLRDLESRIAWCVANGGVTPDEANELTELAQSQAAPPDIPTSEESAVMLGKITGEMALLTARVDKLEAKGTVKDDEEEPKEPTQPQPPPGIEPWKPNNAYKYGDTAWYDGAVWLSKVGNNRIEPGKQAYAWERMS